MCHHFCEDLCCVEWFVFRFRVCGRHHRQHLRQQLRWRHKARGPRRQRPVCGGGRRHNRSQVSQLPAPASASEGKGVNAQAATTRATSDKIVASNYPFAKLMEIAESVPTGRVRQATKFFKLQATKILKFLYNFMLALQQKNFK